MAFDTTAATAQEPELGPSARAHQMNERREAIGIVVLCTRRLDAETPAVTDADR